MCNTHDKLWNMKGKDKRKMTKYTNGTCSQQLLPETLRCTYMQIEHPHQILLLTLKRKSYVIWTQDASCHSQQHRYSATQQFSNPASICFVIDPEPRRDRDFCFSFGVVETEYDYLKILVLAV